MVTDITKRIKKDADLAFGPPSETVNTNTKRTPWWNQECFLAVKNRRRAQRKAEKHPTTENLQNLRKLYAISRNVCRTSKRKSLQEYISGLTHNVSQTQVWNKIKKFKSSYQQPTYPLVQNDVPLVSPIDKGNAFGKHFQNKVTISEQNDNLQKYTKDAIKEMPTNRLGVDITMTELETTIKSLKNSSPGPDNISNKIVKLLNYNYILDILTIFNQSLCTGIVPTEWKLGHIIPIH